jgi:hypothetical protein
MGARPVRRARLLSTTDQSLDAVDLRVPARGTTVGSDPLVAALARYVEALERRYPDGPEQLRLASPAGRANMPTMSDRKRPPAA